MEVSCESRDIDSIGGGTRERAMVVVVVENMG